MLVSKLVDTSILHRPLGRSTRGLKRPGPTVLRRFPQFLNGTYLISHLIASDKPSIHSTMQSVSIILTITLGWSSVFFTANEVRYLLKRTCRFLIGPCCRYAESA